jgi:tRNA guanosine-2'-O-methyltransferase
MFQQNHGVLGGHINFLFEAFLPWATEGSLFTSTLTATRTETICAHGSRLSAVTAKFVTDTASKPSFVPSTNSDAQEVDIDNQHGRAVIIGVVRYIMNARGRIFQPAILYLLDGLVAGLEDRLSKDPLKSEFSRSDIDEILSLARLTGLPEISSDLHSVYCRRLCDLVAPELMSQHLPSDMSLRARYRTLEGPVDRISLPGSFDAVDGELPSLEPIFNELHATKYRCLQGPAFTPACKSLTKILGQLHVASVEPNVLYEILAAFWEEAEIRDFGRPFSVHLPPLLFHPICIQTCLATDLESTAASEGKSKLLALLGSAMIHLQKLSRGRSYIIAVLATSLRKAAFINPSIISLLPFEDFILNFINDAPSIRSEFLFEVAAAEKLQKIIPHRSYTSYYGLREWHAYTAVIDILWRFPGEQVDVAKRILDRLLDPWRAQQPPVQVKNPWKSTLQLQAILLLSDYCLTESDADIYLDSLTHALVLESWPRYRHLLEWTIARIYCRFPGRTSRIISDLEKLEDYSPIHIASLIKLGLLVAPVGSEDFAVKLMTQLNSYSASPKVQIRHEANFAFPLVFELAVTRDWKNIVDNPVFAYMNTFIRNLDKFNATPWTIRTLKLDIVKDFTVVGVFQGRYLSIESPEPELVTYEDFEKLRMDDKETHAEVPPARIELGEEPKGDSTVATPATSTSALTQSIPIQSTQTILQTKAGVDIDNLHPPSGSPEKQNQRPASVMMIASLIDNPTNLGGLSRISESFGLEAMYIDELRKAEHKDFKATSVRSEKHLAIRELKEKNVPTFLMEAKSRGYEVVGIEQTDRSGILGNGEVHSEAEKGGEIVRSQDIGTLPKKCCLVLGSEKEGISPEVLAVIDRCVEIKTVGVTRSLSKSSLGVSKDLGAAC